MCVNVWLVVYVCVCTCECAYVLCVWVCACVRARACVFVYVCVYRVFFPYLTYRLMPDAALMLRHKRNLEGFNSR